MGAGICAAAGVAMSHVAASAATNLGIAAVNVVFMISSE
jgi:hypothetical protein